MKIGCDHCGAGYSVREEKIAGRKLKLRCKRCGEPIAVDGTSLRGDDEPEPPAFGRPTLTTMAPPAPSEEAEAAPDELVDAAPAPASALSEESPPDESAPAEVGSGEVEDVVMGGRVDTPPAADDAVWHLAIEDRTQGPYTAVELASMLSQGVIDPSLLCWRDGIDDWQPVGETAEIMALPATPVPAPAAPAMGLGMAAAGQAAFAMGGDPFATAQEPASIASVPSEPAEPVPGDPRLSAEDIMGGSSGGGTVQFSMDEIRAISSASLPPAARAHAMGSLPPGHASGDDSGLIDMKALAAMEQPSQDEDDLLHAPSATPLDSLAPIPLASLSSPFDDAERPSFKRRVYVGVAAFGGVLAAAVILVALLHEPAAPVQVAAATIDGTPAATPGVAASEASAPEPAAAEPAEPAEAEEPAAEEPEADDGADEAEAEVASDDPEPAVDQPARKRGKAKRRVRDRARAKRAKPEKKSGDIDDLIAKKDEKPSSKSSDIDDLLLSAVRGGGKSSDSAESAPKEKSEALPKAPNRDQTLSALGKVKSKVKKLCKGGGVATADITVANSGRVSSVAVSGVSGASKSCVERAVKGARFPKFSQPSFKVKFPFKLPG